MTYSYHPSVAPHHVEILAASAISPEIAQQRGYRSISGYEAQGLGFSKQQALSGLLIPRWNAWGEKDGYQLRPDEPRLDAKGRPRKYESPLGQANILDIPSCMTERVRSAQELVFITEGARKCDCLASFDIPAISIPGVWNWRGKNKRGGFTDLDDWGAINIKGNHFCLAFDADTKTNPQVYQALLRLRSFLLRRGADQVKCLVLPDLGDGKTGVDDYIHSLLEASDSKEQEQMVQQALLHLVQDEIPAPAELEGISKQAGPYLIKNGATFFEKDTKNGPVLERLANFNAHIVREELFDDGADTRTRLVIEGTLASGAPLTTTNVDSSAFGSLNWVTTTWGSRPIVSAGMGAKDRLREAIQQISDHQEQVRVYGHLGWKRIDGEWMFLHADGAISEEGLRTDVEVDLGDSGLKDFRLPAPPTGQELRDAVRGSMSFRDLGDNVSMSPLFAAIYRAPLGEAKQVDLSLFTQGMTGSQKTERDGIAQAHFGDFNARHLPANWEWTENALERAAFIAKDCIFVIDDFVPSGGTSDVQKQHRKAERVMRAQGNRAGRGRMRSDTTLRPEYYPRGLVVSSGEDVPHGQSLAARMVVTDLERGAIDLKKLTTLQHHAEAGVFAAAMAGYVQFLAPKMDVLNETLRRRQEALRTAARLEAKDHDRIADNIASLMLGIEVFCSYAWHAGALTIDEARSLRKDAWDELAQIGRAQGAHQHAANPADRYLELLSASLAAGRAYLSDATTDGEPGDPAAWGWEKRETLDGITWTARGTKIGWIEGTHVYLEPEVAFGVVQQLGSQQQSPLSFRKETVHRRLNERRLLVSTDPGQLTMRKSIKGNRRRVLHLSADTLLSKEQSNQSNQSTNTSPEGDDEEIWPGDLDWNAEDEPEPVPVSSPSTPTNGQLGLDGLVSQQGGPSSASTPHRRRVVLDDA